MAVTSPSSTTPLSAPSATITASSTQPAIVEYISSRIADFREATNTSDLEAKKDLQKGPAELIDEKAQELQFDARLARKIAFCESSLQQFDKDGQVIRGTHNPSDIGLFQINEKYHLAKSRELGYDIYTTEGNINYAFYLLKKEGTRHWYWSKPCWSKESPEL